MKSLFSFYHTSDELQAEVARLEEKCDGATLSKRTINTSDVSMDVISVTSKDVKPEALKPRNRVFLVFGEHSRELISPETGLHFLKVLCGEASAGQSKVSAADALRDSDFQMVLNANPRSRLKVEDGEFCLRANPSGVDLNRNWDEKFEAGDDDDTETNAGKQAFSEPETQILKDVVTAFKPTVFLIVHSGTRGLYMPYAYDRQHRATRNKLAMLEVLKELDASHCRCPYGAAGKEVGYACPGTSFDWVYDKLEVPYSFAFEIYGGPPGLDAELEKRWNDKMAAGGALLQETSHLGHPHFSDLFQKHPSDFVQVSLLQQESMQRADACFNNFNPNTQERYDETVQNWAAAFLEMAKLTAQRQDKDDNAKAAV